jgi:hypothetical protein
MERSSRAINGTNLSTLIAIGAENFLSTDGKFFDTHPVSSTVSPLVASRNTGSQLGLQEMFPDCQSGSSESEGWNEPANKQDSRRLS